MVEVKAHERTGMLTPSLYHNRKYAKSELFKNMERKPYHPNDLPSIYFNKITDEEREFINSLEEYTPWDLYEIKDNEEVLLSEYFRPNLKCPVWFILTIGNSSILIDTEGYEYARYAGKIIYPES